jgi:XTP/dITP diphosphohydrolase
MHDKSTPSLSRIHVATTNPGKLREFRETAKTLGLDLELLPGLKDLPPPIEDGATFEQNAKIKAEYYSRFFPEELVLAEDSGLAVDELNGAPGVYSARYAAALHACSLDDSAHTNSNDDENNLALVSRLERLPPGKHAGKYVCVIAIARQGKALATFVGEAPGELLTHPRGSGGFGYDPLFYFPSLGKTFAELTLEQKSVYSHRGQAFRRFLKWYSEPDRGR